MSEKKSKSKELTEREKFCLCGYLTTKDRIMAYTLSRKTPPTDNAASLSVLASRWLGSKPVVEFIEARQKSSLKAVQDSEPKNRTRQDAVSELNALISATDDPKTKGDLLLKLADVNRWKQAEQEDEEKAVTFYLPLTVDRAIEYLARKLREHFGTDENWEAEAVKVMRESPGI